MGLRHVELFRLANVFLAGPRKTKSDFMVTVFVKTACSLQRVKSTVKQQRFESLDLPATQDAIVTSQNYETCSCLGWESETEASFATLLLLLGRG